MSSSDEDLAVEANDTQHEEEAQRQEETPVMEDSDVLHPHGDNV